MTVQIPPGAFQGSGVGEPRDATAPSWSPLDGLNILAAEDDFRLARQLEQALLDAGGYVVGPAETVSDALRLINVEQVDGAILDTVLHREVPTLVAERLSDKDVPFVFHADARLPDELWARFPLTPVCAKSMEPTALVRSFSEYLAKRLDDADGRDHRAVEPRLAM